MSPLEILAFIRAGTQALDGLAELLEQCAKQRELTPKQMERFEAITNRRERAEAQWAKRVKQAISNPQQPTTQETSP